MLRRFSYFPARNEDADENWYIRAVRKDPNLRSQIHATDLGYQQEMDRVVTPHLNALITALQDDQPVWLLIDLHYINLLEAIRQFQQSALKESPFDKELVSKAIHNNEIVPLLSWRLHQIDEIIYHSGKKSDQQRLQLLEWCHDVASIIRQSCGAVVMKMMEEVLTKPDEPPGRRGWGCTIS